VSLKLYDYFRSSAAFRVRIALNYKGLSYESISKKLREGQHRAADYRALNPQALVPALDDGGIVIPQSVAIIEYLEEKHPAPPLLPRGAAERALVRSMALAVACDVHPLNNLRVLNFLQSPLGIDKSVVEKTWIGHWIAEAFSGLEQQARKASADKRHMFGSSVTMADVFIVPQMYNARRFGCDLAPFPTLAAICTYLESLPAFARAMPEAQPDAAP
jgi:maleylacetoacetate isomerase